MTDRAQTAGNQQNASGVNDFVEIVKTVAYALLIALFLRVLLFQPFTIPSASMEPTLLEGDYIIVTKFSYGYSRHSIPFSPPLFDGRVRERKPERGDVVVFKLPRDSSTDYIKRLIGLPGDTVQGQNGQVLINGEPLDEPYLDEGVTTGDFDPVEVPEGHLFMMGDNRGDSRDSRFFGPIAEETIVGRAFFRVWPLGDISTL